MSEIARVDRNALIELLALLFRWKNGFSYSPPPFSRSTRLFTKGDLQEDVVSVRYYGDLIAASVSPDGLGCTELQTAIRMVPLKVVR